MKTKARNLAVDSIDITQAKAAFEALLPQLELVGPQESPRVDLQLAGALVCSIVVRDSQTARHAVLDKLAAGGHFDLKILERLRNIGLASWYVRQQQLQALALTSRAVVDETSLKEAQLTRARMLRVLEYYLDDEPAHFERIAAIRAGNGYIDLANDLTAVADYYEEPSVQKVIVHDTKRFDANDPAHARALAQTIFRALGLRGENAVDRWTTLAAKLWPMLVSHYEELRAAGQWAFRKDEDTSLTYPSLITALRAHAPSKSKGEANPSATRATEFSLPAAVAAVTQEDPTAG